MPTYRKRPAHWPPDPRVCSSCGQAHSEVAPVRPVDGRWLCGNEFCHAPNRDRLVHQASAPTSGPGGVLRTWLDLAADDD
jgi:hypothetical protein